ncbi:MAG TPA: adenylate/guanylate cyclase domain-containing protein, partial [Candidatus Cloacimonadota bacterium]|nr:adenylate/guanylate cyclase domain-containing protein [Candidatus Cloacimonadota bacterium]
VLQSSYGYFVQTRRERRLAQLFGQYVPRELVAEMSRRPGSYGLGGDNREMTVLFSDIQDFTVISENLDPHQLTRLMQFILTPLTHAIHEQRGTVDKYIGDALLALFNVPLPKPDYCRDACMAALGIIAEANKLQGEYASHPTLGSFRIGVGIASGEIIAGNFGSDEIFNYTGIGDRMNLASRLESLNKVYLSSIIIDAATYNAVKEHFLCRHLDRVCVKGKGEPSDVYELLCQINEASPALNSFCAAYDEAIGALIAGNKECAAKLFGRCLIMTPEDYPSHLMLHRMKDIDWHCWDGIWRFENK